MERYLLLFLCLSAHLFKECHTFRWEDGGVKNGARLVQCLGEAALFPWRYSLDEDDQLIGLSWDHRAIDTQRETSLGSFILDTFNPKDDRITQVGEAGIRVADIGLGDTGVFTVYAQLSGELPTSQSAHLLVAEPPKSSKGFLEVSVVTELPLEDKENNNNINDDSDNIAKNNNEEDGGGDGGVDTGGAVAMASSMTHQESTTVQGDGDLRLTCGHFTDLGTPPVSVVWEDPEGNILPSSSYKDGFFVLELLEKESKEGNYHCLLNLSSEAVSCLPADGGLRAKARISVLKQPATSDSASSQNKAASMGGAMIAGIIIAVLLVVIIVIGVVIFVVWRGRRGKSYAPKEPDSPGPDDESAQPFNKV